MKAVVAAFNQEKALVGAFSVITNLRMELFEALVKTQTRPSDVYSAESGRGSLVTWQLSGEVALVTQLNCHQEF